MTDQPPILSERSSVDAEHLKLLSIFHFVVAGFALCGIGFLALHYVLMNSFVMSPKLWEGHRNAAPPPREFFAVFKWFYVVFGFFLLTGFIGNLLSGLFIRARRHRIFSLIVSGLNCLHMPFGTVLGVFTIIVLVRNSVRELYDSRGPS